MFNALGKVVGGFVVLLLIQALMKVLGSPLLDLIPPGAWGLEWAGVMIRWATTPDAVFWLLALGAAVVTLATVRGRWLTRAGEVVVVLSVTVGVIGGAVYRLTHLQVSIANFAVDPSFWFLLVGLAAPIVLSVMTRGAEALLSVIERRRVPH